jgi:multidrug efflux pump subunit AcrA (membrane-fusion protein)
MKTSCRVLVRVVLSGTFAGALALAHEGHKPITSKGVSFGPRSRHLLVEPRAARAIGLETAKVDFADLEEVLRVPGRVVEPQVLRGEVPERSADLVRVGMTVRIGTLQGRVDKIADEISHPTRSLSFWAVAGEAAGLRSGDPVEMDLVVGVSKNACAAPLEAIVREGLETFALVREKAGVHARVNPAEREEEYRPGPAPGFVLVDAYEKRNLVLGRTDGRMVEVLEGLYPGDEVIGRGSRVLSSLYTPDPSQLSDAARKNLGLVVEGVALHPVDRTVTFNATLHSRPLRAQAWASPEDAREISAGVPVAFRLRAVDGREWKGDVIACTPDGAFFSIVSGIEKADALLRPGMSGQLVVALERFPTPVLVTPLRSLLRIDGRPYAFVEAGKGFRRVPVRIGRSDAAHAEVLEGLRPGDRVAVSALNELNSAFSSSP